MTLIEVCQYLRNWFTDLLEMYHGHITIENGALVESYGLKPNQYFRIVGSVFNDGIYQYPLTMLQDESFDGSIWRMSVPPDLIQLISEMNTWEGKNNLVLNSPYQSESKADYSYSLRTNSNGKSISAIDQFSNRLARWRKI